MTMTPEQFANLYDPAVQSKLNIGAKSVPDIAGKLFKKPLVDSSDLTYQSRQYGNLGNWLQVPDGQPVPADAYFEGYGVTITPLEFKQNIGATQREIEADKPHRVIQASGDMSIAWYQTYQEQAAAIFNNAATSPLGGDGVYLASNSHPYSTKSPEHGDVQDNLLASTALSDTNIKTARTALLKQKDERGRYFLDTTKKLYLVVPPDLEDTADVIVNSRLRSHTADNDKNVNEGRFEIVVWNKLSSASTWFLVHPDSKLLAIDSVPMSISAPEINRALWTVNWYGRAVVGFGFEDWRGFVMCTA